MSSTNKKIRQWHAAYVVLNESDQPMTPHEIWDEIERRKLWSSTGKTPWSTLSSNLLFRTATYTGVNAMPAEPYFVKKASKWQLSEWGRDNPPKDLLNYPDCSFSTTPNANDPESPTKPTPETRHQIKLLRWKKNLILEGVPGTGKTYALGDIRKCWKSVTNRPLADVESITFHPSTSYEDFVEGIRPIQKSDTSKAEKVANIKGFPPIRNAHWFFTPVETAEGSNWGLKDGFFLRQCRRAVETPDQDVLILVDELNRANVPKVLGDLLTTLEASKRATFNPETGAWNVTDKVARVTLPNSGRLFFVPDNLYVLATLNTSDRSVAPLDAALRRRFAFERLEPMDVDDLKEKTSNLETHIDIWAKLNKALNNKIGPDAKLGHSYYFDMDNDENLAKMSWQQEMLPQLIDTLMSANQLGLLDESDIKGPLDELEAETGLKVKIHGQGLHKFALVKDTKTPSNDISADQQTASTPRQHIES